MRKSLFISFIITLAAVAVQAQGISIPTMFTTLKCNDEVCFADIVKNKGFVYLDKTEDADGNYYQYIDDVTYEVVSIYLPADKSFTTVSYNFTSKSTYDELIKVLKDTYSFRLNKTEDGTNKTKETYFSNTYPKASVLVIVDDNFSSGTVYRIKLSNYW